MRDADKSPVVFYVQNDLPPPYAKGRYYFLIKSATHITNIELYVLNRNGYN